MLPKLLKVRLLFFFKERIVTFYILAPIIEKLCMWHHSSGLIGVFLCLSAPVFFFPPCTPSSLIFNHSTLRSLARYACCLSRLIDNLKKPKKPKQNRPSSWHCTHERLRP